MEKKPKQSALFVNVLNRRQGKMDLIRKGVRRCANCLKYENDEVPELKTCGKCQLVKYCSKECQVENFKFHKYHCEYLDPEYNASLIPTFHRMQKVDPDQAKLLNRKMNHFPLFATAVQNEDHYLLEMYVQTCLKFNDGLSTLYLSDQIGGILLFLGRYQEAYDFLKSQIFNRVNNTQIQLRNQNMKEDFLLAIGKKRVFKSWRDDKTDKTFRYFQEFLQSWFLLITIKIQVIEEMKFLLAEYNAYCKKCRIKFCCKPRILKCLTYYILGQDEETFEKELEEQQRQLNELLKIVGNVGRDFEFKKDCRLEFDVLRHVLIDPFEFDLHNGLNLDSLERGKPFVYLPIFILSKYYSRHPTARQYVKDFLGQNDFLVDGFVKGVTKYYDELTKEYLS